MRAKLKTIFASQLIAKLFAELFVKFKNLRTRVCMYVLHSDVYMYVLGERA